MALPTFGYLALLTVQFGLQPILTKTLISAVVFKPSLVFASESLKLLLGLALLFSSTSYEDRSGLLDDWSLRQSCKRALPPGILYSIQNYLILYGSMSLSPLTLSLLNQTKTLSAAYFSYLLLGKTQTFRQVIALLGLVLGATLIVAPWQQLSLDTSSSSSSSSSISSSSPAMGIAAVTFASLLSGLSSALCEVALQTNKSAGISLVFSMELAVFSLLSLVYSLSTNKENLFKGWTMWTWIPVLTSALGGILVGIVTQRAGGVAKGIALIFGLVITCFLEALLLNDRAIVISDFVAVLVVCASQFLYNSSSGKRVLLPSASFRLFMPAAQTTKEKDL